MTESTEDIGNFIPLPISTEAEFPDSEPMKIAFLRSVYTYWNYRPAITLKSAVSFYVSHVKIQKILYHAYESISDTLYLTSPLATCINRYISAAIVNHPDTDFDPRRLTSPYPEYEDPEFPFPESYSSESTVSEPEEDHISFLSVMHRDLSLVICRQGHAHITMHSFDNPDDKFTYYMSEDHFFTMLDILSAATQIRIPFVEYPVTDETELMVLYHSFVRLLKHDYANVVQIHNAHHLSHTDCLLYKMTISSCPPRGLHSLLSILPMMNPTIISGNTECTRNLFLNSKRPTFDLLSWRTHNQGTFLRATDSFHVRISFPIVPAKLDPLCSHHCQCHPRDSFTTANAALTSERLPIELRIRIAQFLFSETHPVNQHNQLASVDPGRYRAIAFPLFWTCDIDKRSMELQASCTLLMLVKAPPYSSDPHGFDKKIHLHTPYIRGPIVLHNILIPTEISRTYIPKFQSHDTATYSKQAMQITEIMRS